MKRKMAQKTPHFLGLNEAFFIHFHKENRTV